MAGLTLPQLLHQGYAAFARCHPLPDSGHKAAWALLVCRTAVLGGHVQGCPEGHLPRVWYNACTHRLCPPWAWVQSERWLVQHKARLRACDHDHGICTRPDALRGLWRAHVRAMPTLVCATVRAPRGELRHAGTYLGAQPGSIAARHPWRQTWVLHPQLPCRVTGGGLSDTGECARGGTGFCCPRGW